MAICLLNACICLKWSMQLLPLTGFFHGHVEDYDNDYIW
ncbi:hypothetical protein GLYMA_06G121850v4 [Glycine max]|nr:hypothetical protein GLYMA_06G121850v4 [Glycine max]KAH1125498.1 hypothetical protein GYH30_014869 [Glycine max]